MIMLTKLVRPKFLFLIVLCGFLTACLDESKTNTDDASYTPEFRNLGVIAGDNAEYEKGKTITLGGRLTGTVTNQTVLWEQTGGTPVEGITDWTKADLSFPSPDVDGLETFKFRISARDSSNNIINDKDGNPLVDEVEILVYDPAVIITLEAEDTNFAVLAGGATLVNNGSNYITGSAGSHTADITPGASVNYTIASGSMAGDKTIGAGFYTLFVRYAIPAAYGGKMAQVKTNGVAADVQFYATSSWNNARVDVIKINEGANTIEVGGGWNYYRIDSILLIPAPKPAKPLAVAPTLVNENATAATKDLMAFLVSNYGERTISGQTEFMDYNDLANKTGLRDFDKVVEITEGKSPAIVAFDLMDYSSSRINCGAEPGTLSEDMINEHNTKNVILSPLWHWNAPTKLIDTTCTGSGNTAWYSGFYSTGTTFNLQTALADTNSADYQALISDMDDIAAELKKFADADIPLLWRPLHEAEGGWFWWGASDAASLKALWVIMYERFTDVHQLNNLVWVYTHAGELSNEWYPGDAYVDIVGYDGYDGKNTDNPFKTQFSTLKDRFDGKKLVALTETGTIPNIELMQQQNSWWAYFVTWSSEFSTDYGPNNADAAKAKASYEFTGILNLDDVPGGRAKVEAGLYTGFEFDQESVFGAQVGWSDTSGITRSSEWASSGSTSLAFFKDLVALGASSDIVVQAYPADGVDVTDMTTMTIKVKTTGAGNNVNAHIFWKSGSDESWPAAVSVPAEGATLTIPLTVDTLSGFGVRFNGVDAASTNAKFFIDEITVSNGTTSKILYDFEPATSGFESQIGWSGVSGITTSNEWSATGARSLALYKNLVAHGSASDVVFQAYPADGINVTDKTTITIRVHALDAGANVNAHIFWKGEGSESWPAAVPVTANGAELTIDVSTVDKLDGIGVRFNGVDAASTNARFFIDTIKVDNTIIYDFEGADGWEFQVNWGTVPGIQLATDWEKTGAYSLSGVTQLVNGDDNIILQTYPAGGLLLGDVTTLKVSAHATDVGNATQAMLFAKDKDGAWKDGGAVALVNGGAELSLDISTMGGELSGFGVRFMGPVNSATESKYYIDDVTFE